MMTEKYGTVWQSFLTKREVFNKYEQKKCPIWVDVFKLTSFFMTESFLKTNVCLWR